jgi:hypothetical protein
MTRIAKRRQIAKRVVPPIHQRPLVVDLQGNGAPANHTLVIVALEHSISLRPGYVALGCSALVVDDAGICRTKVIIQPLVTDRLAYGASTALGTKALGCALVEMIRAGLAVIVAAILV